MFDIQKIKNLGFSENLAKIYITLLRIGKCRASVVLRETGLQRSVVYTGLDELVERELVSKAISHGVALFSANNPDMLVRESEQKTALAQKVADELKNFQGVNNREAIVYEGPDIIERVAEKTLEVENGETVYFLGASKFGVQSNLEIFWKRYHAKREARGVTCRILYDRDTNKEVVDQRNTLSLCEARFMPFGMDLPIWLTIFEDRVAMVVPGDDPPLAFVIKSRKTAEGFKNYFMYLWNQANGNVLDTRL